MAASTGYFPRRRCGTCRLPGHTKTNCNIYDLSTAWDDIDPAAAERRIYRRRQNEIMGRGLKPMTREEYCQAVYGMSHSSLREHSRENRALPAPYTRAMKLKSRRSGLNERRDRHQRLQAERTLGEIQQANAPPSPTPEQRIPVATSPPPAPTREHRPIMEMNIDDESLRVLEHVMGVLEQELQAWVAREHPDMVDVEMDTWFHTTYPDVERRLEDFFYEIASWSQRAHPRPEPPRTSWSQIQPATIATQIVREEPRADEAQVDLTDVLRRSMDIACPQAQATQEPPEDAPVIESKECPICMEAFTGTNHIVGKCGHQFHASCLMQSLRSTDACPCCRQRVL